LLFWPPGAKGPAADLKKGAKATVVSGFPEKSWRNRIRVGACTGNGFGATFGNQKNAAVEISPTHSDCQGWRTRLGDALGTTSPASQANGGGLAIAAPNYHGSFLLLPGLEGFGEGALARACLFPWRDWPGGLCYRPPEYGTKPAPSAIEYCGPCPRAVANPVRLSC
jgi:hypothetical protein